MSALGNPSFVVRGVSMFTPCWDGIRERPWMAEGAGQNTYGIQYCAQSLQFGLDAILLLLQLREAHLASGVDDTSRRD